MNFLSTLILAFGALLLVIGIFIIFLLKKILHFLKDFDKKLLIEMYKNLNEIRFRDDAFKCFRGHLSGDVFIAFKKIPPRLKEITTLGYPYFVYNVEVDKYYVLLNNEHGHWIPKTEDVEVVPFYEIEERLKLRK